MEFLFKLADIQNIAKEIINQSNHKVILFDGQMGAGKTTLIKALSKELGVIDVANSPTFSIVNEYKTETNQTVFHFDLYRLEEEEEAYDMGIDEYFDSGNWCFIEWPEKTPNLIPDEHHTIKFELIDENIRKIIFK
ncbi:tRNA (adenosine(37)-N6)-threonylcarbamoyltransferase complex ATPase subunit type 1 TsaE [Paenimyroides tangerinum]|uniref:tRNA threonylcarbamoyladenosine biosynthesis protein TsaE n=1 Tax=Paenimyroides tangerinum TaxID=2488728 RepID=A0A3P3WD98_9FLAO|nr:tRNA (adenosine(37)-N6)-threonylcarbamoyltransferase complex ATPase subunit type 1 TsaE [Paenimyroides tangerinum]RRJ92036.1 tRNA (adenosine(37)-N6)-threonylcarbamoyltransferase complex ATPase subunit type 1 TsaE [Paenimyroides tangerinum]